MHEFAYPAVFYRIENNYTKREAMTSGTVPIWSR